MHLVYTQQFPSEHKFNECKSVGKECGIIMYISGSFISMKSLVFFKDEHSEVKFRAGMYSVAEFSA